MKTGACKSCGHPEARCVCAPTLTDELQAAARAYAKRDPFRVYGAHKHQIGALNKYGTWVGCQCPCTARDTRQAPKSPTLREISKGLQWTSQPVRDGTEQWSSCDEWLRHRRTALGLSNDPYSDEIHN